MLPPLDDDEKGSKGGSDEITSDIENLVNMVDWSVFNVNKNRSIKKVLYFYSVVSVKHSKSCF